MHFAALAESPEVVGFLLQQTKGQTEFGTRLVDARNNDGEIPLLRSMRSGVIPVARALIEEGSDLFAVDYLGNTVFSTACKGGHLWALNFMYQVVSNKHGSGAALVLLSQADVEDHTPLDWAADTGDVNQIEFLLRKGLDLHRVDVEGRGALFWAVRSGRVEATRIETDIHKPVVVPTWLAGGYKSEASGPARSLAIYRHHPSRLSHVLIYGTVVRRFSFALAEFYRLTRQDLLSCPEKGLGMWLGSVTVYVVYLISCLFWAEYGAGKRFAVSDSTTVRLHDPLGLGGVDGEVDDTYLFWTILSMLVLAAAVWLKLAWLDTDPGIIDTRDENHDEVMTQSLMTSGCPATDKYCRTTLVRKPMRSKYCARTGCVVARMDHYCVWLNISVGHRNHRTFVVFLLLHLLVATFSTVMIARQIGSKVACDLLVHMLSTRFFIVTTLCAFMLLTALGLLALTIEQLSNVARNLTINEKVNRARYSYLRKGPDGSNIFDRGVFTNILEFCGVPGYAVDYYTQFDIPLKLEIPLQSRNSPDSSHSSRQAPSSVGATSDGKEEEGLERLSQPSRLMEPEHNLRRRPPCGDAVDMADVV
eukprot:gene21517-27552_t